MARSIEPTLLTLLPNYSSSDSLPRELIDLASSLHIQSRHNASTLRAEEEVARLYACAHIACERLKIKLDLPQIQPRPPVPPRIYKRLYNHLDHILPATSGKVRTPSSKARDTNGIFGDVSTQRTRERPTPGKDASLAQFRSPLARGDGTPSKFTSVGTKRKASALTREHALPTWIRPTIKSICTQLNNEQIGRTVLAGMQTIVVPQNGRTKDKWVNEHLTALLAAVYSLVATKVIHLETGDEFDSKTYSKMRRNVLNALQNARAEIENVDWDGWTEIGNKDFDSAVNTVVDSDWQQDEWFTGLQELVRNQGKENGNERDDIGMEEGKAKPDGQQKGLTQKGDTMLQSRWELTDRKREEYLTWKKSILRRVEEIEKSKDDSMDVDVAAGQTTRNGLMI